VNREELFVTTKVRNPHMQLVEYMQSESVESILSAMLFQRQEC